jgi:hypothetical protein
MQRPFKKVLITFAVMLALLLGWMGTQLLTSRTDGIPLAVKWEGLWIDKNARDLGASLNDCLGEPVFAPDRIFRANVWYSGWSCQNVGNPDVIYSLNFAPERDERYFCRDDEQLKVGRHFNDFKLNDLEFVKTWDEPGVTAAVCGFIRDELASLAAGKRILVHCDAGKDRAATNSALLAALAAEHAGRLDDRMIAALECDYRKSKRLERDKYGRMDQFIRGLRDGGGVTQFLQSRCGLTAADVAAAASSLITAR